MIELSEYQLEALDKMKNGCILCGTVGSGKSRVSLAYYVFKVLKGEVPLNGHGSFDISGMKDKPLYIITTAKKRDNLEWYEELQPFNIPIDDVVVDSWNNIKKYKDVFGAFFIFDEQRVVGSGAWVKSFLDICRKNQWILLSATPGDKWDDYRTVFIANGFYKHKTEFEKKHCIFSPYVSYKKVERYINQGELARHRNDILVRMNPPRNTVRHELTVTTEYNKDNYKKVIKEWYDIFNDEPIEERAKMAYVLRRVVNTDPSRVDALRRLLSEHNAIVFYNFTYELEIIRSVCEELGICYAEWNGQKHQPLPEGDRWVYIVQYTAGCEGWNCITTDTIIFYSLNYSYKVMEQAAGRIDRMNTPFKDLYYYRFRSSASIDVAIGRALKIKHNFNEKAFLASTQLA